ncbi:MAG: hypothetical protein HRU19_15445 [Pseudobacteriovorax sp.]|nr:hypothetical protein [Pseudobacteriovorax sp.]
MSSFKRFLGTLALSFCFLGIAEARTIEGTPVQRKIFETGCAFRCPTGLVFVRGVEFRYKVGISEYKRDGGTLFCLGNERRIVQKATIPSILSRVASCSVDIIGIGPGDLPPPGQSCNQEQLNICLDFQGGQACYEKWCN